MKAAFLSDRGVVKVSGDDARTFVNNIVTTDVDLLTAGLARFGALLTPQGKIIADFLVTQAPPGLGGGLLFDCPKVLAPPFTDRLGFYKLRAKVAVENISDSLGVLAVWDGEPAMKPDLTFADPRDAQLGWRILVPSELAQKAAEAIGAQMADQAAYDAHRIACGVPRGGVDFIYGDAFPHETNMDRLHGIDFDKGCYIGQEVVSRTQHRGMARTRIIRVGLKAGAPEPGATIMAGDKSVGTMGSAAQDSSGQGIGLASLRTDRTSDALDAGLPLIADGIPISLLSPDDVRSTTKASA
ncbi:MAG: folate-binding protein [Xanthobacteraceae bacterium]|nr:folate-binding protein [Xanthobacteraceae bacterium]